MNKYQNKYRIKSNRLQNWDYGWNAYYFITAVTHNRKYYFGNIKNGKLIKSILGEVACNEWLKTPQVRSDMKIILDEYCVMPNHFHAIIKIGKNQYNQFDDNRRNDNSDSDSADRDAMHRVSTNPTTNNPSSVKSKNKNQFGPQRKNLSSIIRGFKSAVTTFARKNNIEFDWQPNYHDHIIRDKQEYFRIKNYIINNPTKWNNDTFQ
jgi:REP element-mobilizing transposase RayT